MYDPTIGRWMEEDPIAFAGGDSNLYLKKQGEDALTLTVEHRAAASIPAITLALAKRADAVALEIFERPPPSKPVPSSVDERIIAALSGVDRPLHFAELRALCRVRSATIYARLEAGAALA